MIRKEDGYINATQLCKSGGKEFKKWHKNDKTKQLVEKVCIKTKIDKDSLIQINKSGLNEERCTWVHPTIGLHIAQWISTDFFLQTVDWIREWIMKIMKNTKKPLRLLYQIMIPKRLKKCYNCIITVRWVERLK